MLRTATAHDPPPRSRSLLVLIAGAWLGLTAAGQAGGEHPQEATPSEEAPSNEGMAVAPFAPLDVPDNTAAILTGIAEGVAMQQSPGGRFVAHGELLRAVDDGEDRGCRSIPCLAHAAASLGATHLLSGEVGSIGESYVVTVQLTRAADEVSVTAASRQCGPCDEGALPGLLDDALHEALATAEHVETQVSDDGRTIALTPRRREAAVHFQDRHRVVQTRSVDQNGIVLSSLTVPDDRLGHLEPGESVRFVTALQALNTTAVPAELVGELGVEIVDAVTDEPVVGTRYAVHQTLGAADDDSEPFADDGSWIPPTNVLKDSVELQVTAVRAVRLRVRVTWDDALLEELVTRPVARVARVDDVYLEHAGTRVHELTWGEPMQAHVVLTKLEPGANAEVTLRMRRKPRYWFDTDDAHAFHAVPADADGAFHLILPFVPNLAQRDSTESIAFEVWINGCLLHQSPVYR